MNIRRNLLRHIKIFGRFVLSCEIPSAEISPVGRHAETALDQQGTSHSTKLMWHMDPGGSFEAVIEILRPTTGRASTGFNASPSMCRLRIKFVKDQRVGRGKNLSASWTNSSGQGISEYPTSNLWQRSDKLPLTYHLPGKKYTWDKFLGLVYFLVDPGRPGSLGWSIIWLNYEIKK